MAIDSNAPLSKTGDLSLDDADPAVSAGEANSPDPLTGEPGAHPGAVGLGAVAAGALGAAAIGAFAGPIGAVIGAAIGAVAGGLTGHEVAVASETPPDASTTDLNGEENGSPTDPSGRPSSVTEFTEEKNIAVFPGLDLGSPSVTTQNAAAVAFASDAFTSAPKSALIDTDAPLATGESPEPAASHFDVANTSTAPVTHDAPVESEEPEDFAVGGEAASPFTIGADPTETIRTAAYYRYVHRLEDGRPLDALADWCEAEREVYRF